MRAVIEVDHLSKSFGKTKAVDNISFEVAEGEVFGLLGPNGAGKTTTLRILATLLRADAGTATINGLDIVKDAEKVRRIIGVVNGGMGLYDRLTGREVLHYFGQLYGMKRSVINARIKLLDELLDLRDTLDRRTADFSTGMKQKIVVARAVLHDPPVIFFDEATAGLDVMARRAVMNFVKRYPAENRMVIYSTHVMSEVEELCDRAAIIYRGRLVALDTIAGLVSLGHADTLEQAFFNIVSDSNLSESEPLEASA